MFKKVFKGNLFFLKLRHDKTLKNIKKYLILDFILCFFPTLTFLKDTFLYEVSKQNNLHKHEI